MSELKHTPGPWAVEHGGSGKFGGKFVIEEYFVKNRDVCDDIAIASDIIDPKTSEPSLANARLIAAAPELLEALKGIRELIGYEWMRPEFNQARDAIAKAEGKWV